MSAMATKSKPVLSPSRIAMYLACPAMYRWTYEDPRGRWFRRAKPYFSFGTTLHKALQRFHEEGGVGVVPKETLLASYEATWIDAGYDSEEESRRQLEAGKELLDKYYERQRAEPSKAKPVYMERLLRYDMGPFILAGRVDRVDEYPDGRLEIVDYKSGRDHVDVDDVREDLAMCAYQLLLKRIHPEREVFATIHSLRSANHASYALHGIELEQFSEALRELGEEILDRDYDSVEPVAKTLCLRCDFVALCRHTPDFSETYEGLSDVQTATSPD